MSTVLSRSFASTPKRDAGETWAAIVDLLTGENQLGTKRTPGRGGDRGEHHRGPGAEG